MRRPCFRPSRSGRSRTGYVRRRCARTNRSAHRPDSRDDLDALGWRSRPEHLAEAAISGIAERGRGTADQATSRNGVMDRSLVLRLQILRTRIARVPDLQLDPAEFASRNIFTKNGRCDARADSLDHRSRTWTLMIIAIDGPAASGKGTLGKRLAHHYGYRHLDTGVIYRAVAKALLDAGLRPHRRGAGGGGCDGARSRKVRTSRAEDAAHRRCRLGRVGDSRACARRWSIFSASSRPIRRAPCSTGATSEP